MARAEGGAVVSLLDNIPEALTRPLDDASVQARIRADSSASAAARHSARVAIPVIAERSIALFALWNAAILAPGCGTVYVHESGSPGAAEALRAWAAAHGYAIEDHIMLTDHGNYRSLGVTERGCNISVLRYRDATEEEVEIEQMRLTAVGRAEEQEALNARTVQP